MIVMMLAFLISLLVFLIKGINARFIGFVFILFGYGFWYSFLTYITLLTPMSAYVRTTILSGIWLTFSLLLYIKVRHDKAAGGIKVLTLILLILTLAKIAFLDLVKLPSGLTRIIGFTVFGILLLIGGLLLKNE